MQNLLPKIKRKVLFKNYQSPGDIVMLSAAIRDLKLSHPDIEIGLDCSCKQIFENNPYLVPHGSMKKGDPGVEFYKAEYPLIHESNEGQYHFIHGFRKWMEDHLDLKIKATKMKGDIHLSEEERGWMSQIEEMGCEDRFWIINAGIKYDFTAKAYDPRDYQKIVDHFKGKITFVQIGQKEHWHPPLKNVINLIGRTNLRQLIRLVYHSIGVLCPITLLMHLSSAVESKHGLLTRPCVCIAGGREPNQWEAMPGHQFLHRMLSCCDLGGCWKSRASLVGDGDEKDEKDLCINPIEIDYQFKDNKMKIPKCMKLIRPEDVIRAIETYYEGGILEYGSTLGDKKIKRGPIKIEKTTKRKKVESKEVDNKILTTSKKVIVP